MPTKTNYNIAYARQKGKRKFMKNIDYREKIVEILNKTSNNELLELIYRFCKSLVNVDKC